jgi:hypothetical protein
VNIGAPPVESKYGIIGLENGNRPLRNLVVTQCRFRGEACRPIYLSDAVHY